MLEGIELPYGQWDSPCKLLHDNHDVFSLEEGEHGKIDLIEFTIDTDNAAPYANEFAGEVSNQLQKMRESGIIQPSSSPWASPVVLVQ